MSKVMYAATRKQINNKLYNMGSYHPAIPLSDIDNVLKAHGYELVDEDGMPLSCLLCGENSHCTFDIGAIAGDVYPRVKADYCLQLSWYKMPSGRYEIVAYVM